MQFIIESYCIRNTLQINILESESALVKSEFKKSNIGKYLGTVNGHR